MPEVRDRLIETAVRPFADNAEVKLAAAEMLEGIVPQPVEGGEDVVRRWDELDERKPRFRWRTAFLIAALLVSGAIVAEMTFWTFNYRRAFNALAGITMVSTTASAFPPTRKEPTEEEKLILLVDGSASRTVSAKALWDLHPESPVYFAKHAEAHLSEHGKLPADFLADARRIDPSNAWYFYVAAAQEADGSIEKKPRTAAAKVPRTPPQWEIRDREKLDRSLALLRQARDLATCQDHKRELVARQVALLKQDTQLRRLISSGYLAGITVRDLISLRKLADAISAKAALLAAERDADGLRELMADADAMARKTANAEPSTMVAGLVYRVINAAPALALADAAGKLGLDEDAARYRKIYDEFERIREARNKIELSVDGLEFQMKSGFIPGLTIPMVHRQVENPPPITEADLKPGRLTDHELVSMLCAVGVFFLLGACSVLVWANRFRLGKPVRELTRRMESLLRPWDWAWIIGCGVILPFLVVFSINRLTPLGGRDLSVFGMKFVLPLGHFIGLFLLCVILPVLIGRWRLGKRAACLGIFWGRSCLGWAAVVLTVGYVAAIGMVVPFSSMNEVAAVTVFLVLAKLWIPTVAGRALAGKKEQLVKSGTMGRVLLPAYASAALLMICLVPVFRAAEQYWFERDHFMMLNPETPGMGSYEYKVAVESQKELRKILGY